MKLSLTATTLSFAFALAVSAPAEAATITFNFNQLVNGPTLTPTASVGTLSLTDNGDFVDISISLSSSKISDFYLNVSGSAPAGYSFSTTLGTVTFGANSQQADGYNIGAFDLKIDAGNLNATSFATTLKLGNGSTFLNLDVSNFIFKTDNNVLYAGLQNNSGAGWIGSTSCTGCTGINPTGLPPGDDALVTPEPASLVLLGSGLLGGAWRMRKRRSAV